MAIEILKMTLGPLGTNCFVLGDTETKDAVVIDPVDRADVIAGAVDERGWTIREILATHTHFDHIMASRDLKAQTGVPFRIHERDLPLLRAMPKQVKEWVGLDVPPAAEPDGFVVEGDVIEVGGIKLDVLFTPGHTLGHVSFVLHSLKVVFSGDVLFQSSVGHTRDPGASHAVLMQSIVEKLFPLGDDFTVAAGHMGETTIGFERQRNPFVLEYLAASS